MLADWWAGGRVRCGERGGAGRERPTGLLLIFAVMVLFWGVAQEGHSGACMAVTGRGAREHLRCPPGPGCVLTRWSEMT